MKLKRSIDFLMMYRSNNVGCIQVSISQHGQSIMQLDTIHGIGLMSRAG